MYSIEPVIMVMGLKSVKFFTEDVDKCVLIAYLTCFKVFKEIMQDVI